MKKFFGLMFALLLALVLVACDDAGADKPVLKGVEPATIMVGDVFDPLEGITATDHEGNDITENILVDGEVNTAKAGVYKLVYSVTDSEGKKASKNRFITVRGLAGFANGDFSDGFEGWGRWFNDSQGVLAEYSVMDGVAIIDVKEQATTIENNWWDVQLSYQQMTFDKFDSFKLIFTAKAESPRKLMLNLQGGGLIEKAIDAMMFDLTTEEQTFEVDFFSKYDAENAELQFSMGSFHQVDGVPEELHAVLGKVYISNIQIVVGPELENQAPTITTSDFLIRVGDDSFLQYQGVLVDDDRDNLKVADVEFEDITEGDKFAFGEPAVKGVYTFKYSVTDSEGLSAEVTRRVTVAEPFELPPLTEVDENGIPVGWIVWHEDTNGGLTVTAEDGVVELDITKPGANPWENQFKVVDLAAFKGDYILKFSARADDVRAMKVAMEGDGGVGLANVTETYMLTKGWVEYEIPFEIIKNAVNTNRNLQFWFGDLSEEEGVTEDANTLTKVYLKDISIELVEEALPSGWDVYNHDGQELIDVSVEDGVIIVDILAVTGDDWMAQLKTKHFDVEEGKRYTISFDARADEERYVRTMFEHAGVPNAYSNIKITEVYSKFEIVFEIKQTADNKVFVFAFGDIQTGRGIDDGVVFTADDNILTKVYIKNYKVEVEDFDIGVGMDINTEMTDDLPEGWSTSGDTFTVTVVDGEMTIDIASIPANDWDARVNTNPFMLVAGETYVIKFQVRADHARKMRLMIEQSGLPNPFDHVDITTEWAEVSVTYVVSEDRGSVVLWFSVGSLTTGREYPGEYVFTEADDIVTKIYIKDIVIERS